MYTFTIHYTLYSVLFSVQCMRTFSTYYYKEFTVDIVKAVADTEFSET